MYFFTLNLAYGGKRAIPVDTIMSYRSEGGSTTVEVRPYHMHKDWPSQHFEVNESYDEFEKNLRAFYTQTKSL